MEIGDQGQRENSPSQMDVTIVLVRVTRRELDPVSVSLDTKKHAVSKVSIVMQINKC